jgi:hypothetical protein
MMACIHGWESVLAEGVAERTHIEYEAIVQYTISMTVA